MLKTKEAKLLKKAKSGDLDSYKILSREGLELGVTIANKYKSDGDLGKLILAGYHGWELAFEKYKPAKYRLSTYAAWWIRAAIHEEITGESITSQAKKEKS